MEPKPTLAILATGIWGTLTVPGLIGAALSVMFFDAPGSMSNPAAYLNALVVISFPCLCIASIVASWILWTRNKHRPTAPAYVPLAAACLPLIPVAYVVLAMVFGTIGVLLSGQPLGLHTTVLKP